MQYSCYNPGTPQAGDLTLWERPNAVPPVTFKQDWAALLAQLEAIILPLASTKIAATSFAQALGVSLTPSVVATPTQDGTYLLAWTFVAASLVGTSSLIFSWTDPAGNLNSTTAFYPGNPFPAAIQVKAGTPVTAQTAVSPSQPAYTLNVTLTKLS